MDFENSILLTSFMIALLLLPALAIWNMLQNHYVGRSKIIWLLIIVFLPFFGPILYFIMGNRYRKHNPE